MTAAFTPFIPARVGDAPIDVRAEAAQAQNRGYAEGYAAGRAQAAADAERDRVAAEIAERLRTAEAAAATASALSALRTARVGLDTQVSTLAEQSAERTESLALSLAAVILEAELSSPARSAAHALRRALDAQPARTWVRVALHPQDVATLSADPSASTCLQEVDVVASVDVEPGGALIELEDGAVDVRIGAAWERAAAAHREGLSGPEGDHA